MKGGSHMSHNAICPICYCYDHPGLECPRSAPLRPKVDEYVELEPTVEEDAAPAVEAVLDAVEDGKITFDENVEIAKEVSSAAKRRKKTPAPDAPVPDSTEE
jgi:hypothetical protein